MTQKEQRVRYRQCALDAAKSKVREAESAYLHGSAKAKADMQREIDRLFHEKERAMIEVMTQQSYLDLARAELENPFKGENGF